MSPKRAQVLIAGGGVAAVEALLALRSLAGRLADITLLSPESEFLYRPVTVAEAFGRAEARTYPLRELLDGSPAVTVVHDSLRHVYPDDHAVDTGSGSRIVYDMLLVAVGAIAREPLPGALTFRGRRDVPALRRLLDELCAGTVRSVALTMTSERQWALPLYELAVMTASHLRDCAVDAPVWLATPEEEPLELFGPAAAQAIEPLLAALRVRLRTSVRPRAIRGRLLVLAGAGDIAAERVVTLPVLEGPRIAGLPCDPHGFVPVDSHGAVRDLSDVYAAGDVTAFPLKQGGLAAQQADAAAEAIAARFGAPVTPTPFRPVLRGLLMTAGAPVYLRAEPHRLKGATTVAVDSQRPRHPIRDGSGAARQPLWWPPAKIAGRYLAPLLATARPDPLTSALLTDRIAGPRPPASDTEQQSAPALALLLAEYDARWGDYASALDALDAAEALHGMLPPGYETKRQVWRAQRS